MPYAPYNAQDSSHNKELSGLQMSIGPRLRNPALKGRRKKEVGRSRGANSGPCFIIAQYSLTALTPPWWEAFPLSTDPPSFASPLPSLS